MTFKTISKQTVSTGVTATILTVCDSSYNALPDLAIRPTGGYIKLTGTGFISGCILYVNGIAAATTFISSTEVRAVMPALSIGTYSVMLFNTATVAAIWASGILYSAAPVWGTTAYANTGNVINTQLLVTGDTPLVYTLASGTLPTGVTLSSGGLLSGTASAITTTTVVSLTILASDPQLQGTSQLITLSITFFVGKLFISGWGNYGQTGQGTTSNQLTTKQVGALTTWKTLPSANQVSQSMLAIKTDGTLWAWGQNANGQLGLGDVVNRSSPVQVGTLSNWLAVASGLSGYCHTIALKTDGTLWTWGDNTQGQLGDGTAVAKSSPIQIGSLTTWSSISTAYKCSLAIKTDGTLWVWGSSLYGQIGNTGSSSPIQFGSGSNWKSVSGAYLHSLGVKTDGTLWAWGYNNNGQLGDGTVALKTTATQIGTLTTWLTSAGGQYHSSAVRSDNTLWVWGKNDVGQLGQNNVTNYSSPKQVGTLTNWKTNSLGMQHTLAIKTDGTLWSWGRNSEGELGDGTSVAKSSPVQIGSLTTWLAVSGGGYFSSALSS